MAASRVTFFVVNGGPTNHPLFVEMGAWSVCWSVAYSPTKQVVAGSGDNNLYKVISKDKNTCRILLNNNVSGKDSLHYINTNYDVLSFKKETPTMEEIFIKAVGNV